MSVEGCVKKHIARFKDPALNQLYDEVDPISVLAWAALCKYMTDDPKLGVREHEVWVEQKKDHTYMGMNLRGPVRWFSGNDHDDVRVIKVAIEKIAKWFKPNTPEGEPYKRLLLYAKDGIPALIKTYENRYPNIASNLREWSKRIDEICSCEQNAEKVENVENSENDKEIENKKSEQEEAVFEDPITERIKLLWKVSEIELMNSAFNHMSETEFGYQPEIKNIQERLNNKTEIVKKIYNRELVF